MNLQIITAMIINEPQCPKPVQVDRDMSFIPDLAGTSVNGFVPGTASPPTAPA